jgi:tetratricopeptide (TPR) repeat protein
MDNSTPDMSELLVQYLDGNLQGPEKENIEQQLAADSALQQQFDSLLLTREAIRYYGLKEKVKSLHQKMMEELKEQAPSTEVELKPVHSRSKIFRYAISVAASIILLVGGYMLYNFITLSSDKVFGANYQHYELSTTRDAGTAETAIEKAYKDNNYKEVVRIYSVKEDVSVKAAFLDGLAAMELNDNSTAISSFKQVLEINKTAAVKSLNDDAEYYLCLSYIRNKDYDYALDIMRSIQNDPGHVYHNKITGKLMRQVKMLKWK